MFIVRIHFCYDDVSRNYYYYFFFWDAFNLKNFICSAVRMCVFDAVCLPARFFKICQVKFHETWLKRRALTKHV